jgi:GTPase SAR1 family protein
LVCFDLTDEESFSRLNFWLQDLQRHAPEKIVKILCGLKYDLIGKDSTNESMSSFRDTELSIRTGSNVGLHRRQVSSEEAHAFALRNKMFYMEVSAKTGHNVSELFYKMATEVNELHRKKQIE